MAIIFFEDCPLGTVIVQVMEGRRNEMNEQGKLVGEQWMGYQAAIDDLPASAKEGGGKELLSNSSGQTFCPPLVSHFRTKTSLRQSSFPRMS